MTITENDQWPAEPTVWRKGDSVFTRIRSLESVTLPDGTEHKLLRNGAVGRFKQKDGSNVLKLRFNRKWHLVPTMDEIQAWTLDSVCETPDGRMLEPDHPDSWLSLLGLV
jgi:hypothetical protein